MKQANKHNITLPTCVPTIKQYRK